MSARVEHSGTVFYFDSEGVDVEHDGHEFRMRKRVIERAADKEYLDVTDHEVARMIEREMELDGPAQRIRDIL